MNKNLSNGGISPAREKRRNERGQDAARSEAIKLFTLKRHEIMDKLI